MCVWWGGGGVSGIAALCLSAHAVGVIRVWDIAATGTVGWGSLVYRGIDVSLYHREWMKGQGGYGARQSVDVGIQESSWRLILDSNS